MALADVRPHLRRHAYRQGPRQRTLDHDVAVAGKESDVGVGQELARRLGGRRLLGRGRRRDGRHGGHFHGHCLRQRQRGLGRRRGRTFVLASAPLGSLGSRGLGLSLGRLGRRPRGRLLSLRFGCGRPALACLQPRTI